MDADDLSEPERIEAQVRTLAAHPNAAATTCQLRFEYPDGRTVIKSPTGTATLRPWFMVFFNNLAGHGQMVFRRDAYDRAGGYDPTFRYSQDHDLWPRLMRIGAIVSTDRPLYRYRCNHEASITNRFKPVQLDCSYRVTMREFAALTGCELPRAEAEIIRAYWISDRARPSRGEVRLIQRRLRQAYRAFATRREAAPDDLAELRRLVAERWLHLAALVPTSSPSTLLSYQIAALGWSSGVLPSILRSFRQRTARAARKIGGHRRRA